ncbi:hypothetical protein HMPREF0548_1839 [Lactobacillus ultunensis DSM 16047]|uniref:HTH lysR-type domain-containing protein n=1 Tax=Lactobacillus ultunensis DSM 16047 TaxID=525365 RepID=C2EQ93_9LACO|nr:hypothetical protein HMPREF0548_1839 [Lactobacillus ultunensis DSM 16047]
MGYNNFITGGTLMNDPEALLHYLDVLLKESNFTKAARELYIS